MQLLKRRENTEPLMQSAAALALRERTRGEAPAEPGPARRPVPLRRPQRAVGEPLAPGYATLLDSLRAYAVQGRPVRTVVVAGASPTAATSAVVSGLATRAGQLGMTVVSGELIATSARAAASVRRAALPERLARPVSTAVVESKLPSTELNGWLEHHAAADLVLIEGPPLDGSIDAALLARACDGMILVAERGVTERTALQHAADRARTAGCRLFGVVLTGRREPMPSWLRRLAAAGR
jgi:hypothetical protein